MPALRHSTSMPAGNLVRSSTYACTRQHTSAYVSICQHTSAYVSVAAQHVGIDVLNYVVYYILLYYVLCIT